MLKHWNIGIGIIGLAPIIVFAIWPIATGRLNAKPVEPVSELEVAAQP